MDWQDPRALSEEAASMTYYEKLVDRMACAMQEHPRSTIAMDAETFAVMATGKSTETVARRIEKSIRAGRTPVVFRRPKKSETWIL